MIGPYGYGGPCCAPGYPYGGGYDGDYGVGLLWIIIVIAILFFIFRCCGPRPIC